RACFLWCRHELLLSNRNKALRSRFAASPLHIVRELPPSRIERISQRDIDVLAMVAVDHDLIARHLEVEMDHELPALPLIAGPRHPQIPESSRPSWPTARRTRNSSASERVIPRSVICTGLFIIARRPALRPGYRFAVLLTHDDLGDVAELLRQYTE